MTPVIMSATGPMFIKDSQPIKKHTKPLFGHTKSLWMFTEIKTLLESGSADRQPQWVSTTMTPIIMSVSYASANKQESLPSIAPEHCRQTTSVCVNYHDSSHNVGVRPHVYKGFPPTSLNNTQNHCVGTQNLCGCLVKSKHYWKATVQTDNPRHKSCNCSLSN